MTLDLVGALTEAVGAGHVLVDADLRAQYERDWTGRFGGPALAVVRPADTAEVATVVAVCAAHGARVVPQGGNTGLVGGGVPRGGEVVVSLRRLTTLGAVDRAAAQVTAGAGVTLAQLQERARTADLDAGLDFGARDGATVGGIVACDAGGARALRHGTARARVAGAEVVLADGAVVSRLSGLLKDNAGYDLTALMVGAEGTLGIVTAVRWRLVPRLVARVAALVPVATVGDATELLAVLRAHAPALDACELMTAAGMRLVLAHQRRAPAGTPAPLHILVELAAASDPTDELMDALARAGIEDAVLADDTASRERLWALREGLPEAIAARGVPHKLDVGLPLGALAAFLDDAHAAIAAAAPGAEAIIFGHLGDGNLHVNVLGLDPADATVDDVVLGLVVEHGGTISAEHGVGVAKRDWLPRSRSRADMAAMRAIKRGLDPAGILNTGAVVSA